MTDCPYLGCAVSRVSPVAPVMDDMPDCVDASSDISGGGIVPGKVGGGLVGGFGLIN